MRMVGRASVLTPWQATWSEPCDHGGVRVPGRMEAAWQLQDAVFTYIRIEITALEWTKDQ